MDRGFSTHRSGSASGSPRQASNNRRSERSQFYDNAPAETINGPYKTAELIKPGALAVHRDVERPPRGSRSVQLPFSLYQYQQGDVLPVESEVAYMLNARDQPPAEVSQIRKPGSPRFTARPAAALNHLIAGAAAPAIATDAGPDHGPTAKSRGRSPVNRTRTPRPANPQPTSTPPPP